MRSTLASAFLVAVAAVAAVAAVVAVAPIAITLTSCQRNVSLGDPQSEVIPNTPDAPCTDSFVSVFTVDPAFGTLRALATSRDTSMIAGVFERDDGSGTLAVASTALGGDGGGAFRQVARIGGDPIAIAFDGTYAWVVTRATSEVARIRVADGITVASQQAGTTSITIANREAGSVAYWTLPANDAVVTWDFVNGAPSNAATFPRASSITSDGNTLYFSGPHALAALSPEDGAPRAIASACGDNPLAFHDDSIFCVDAPFLIRVDVTAGIVITLASGLRGASDVVVARGRVFYRTEGVSGSTIEAVPIDGIGGPTVLDVVAPLVSNALATDGCGLYYSVGTNLKRFAL